MKTFQGHQNAVIDVAFSPDGQQIASSSVDKAVRLWQLEGSAIATLTGYPSGINGIAFSPDGKRLASTSVDKTVSTWELDTAMDSDSLIDFGCQKIQDYLQNSQDLDDSAIALCK